MAHKEGCPLGLALGLLGDGFSSRLASAVNLADSPGTPNIHWNSSLNRGARVGSDMYVLCPQSANVERLYHTTDYGLNWAVVGTTRPYSGGIISGPGGYLYHAYIDRGAAHTIGVIKFAAGASPGSPVTVYNNAVLGSSTVLSEYRNLSIGVDSAGRLFIATHWQSGSGDHTFLFVSTDAGATWSAPIQVSDTTGDFHYCQLIADASDNLIYSWRDETNDDIRTSRSTDHGITWAASVSHAGTGGVVYSNPTIECGASEIHMAAQSDPGPGGVKGVYEKKSTDNGVTWGAWRLVTRTCGYGDPRLLFDSNGYIYCHIRSDQGVPGVPTGSCGLDSRSCLLRSTDAGATWAVVDSYYYDSDGAHVERSGTRANGRYQRHHGGGGPLEWWWLQHVQSETQIPIFYDVNTKITTYS